MTAATLVSYGYDVTVCDPSDGSGKGSTEFEGLCTHLRKCNSSALFPAVARAYPAFFDGIYSVSVFEYLVGGHLVDVFQATEMALKPGGYSIHVVDHVLRDDDAWHEAQVLEILRHQDRLTAEPRPEALLAAECATCVRRPR